MQNLNALFTRLAAENEARAAYWQEVCTRNAEDGTIAALASRNVTFWQAQVAHCYRMAGLHKPAQTV